MVASSDDATRGGGAARGALLRARASATAPVALAWAPASAAALTAATAAARRRHAGSRSGGDERGLDAAAAASPNAAGSGTGRRFTGASSSNSGDAAPTAGDQSRRGSSPRDGTRTVSARGVVRASARGVCAPAQAEAAAARGDAAAASSAAPSKSRRAATPRAAGRAGGWRPGRSLRRGAPTVGAGDAAGDSSAKRNDATRELGAGRRALAGPTRGRLMRNWPPKERLSAPDMLRFIMFSTWCVG